MTKKSASRTKCGTKKHRPRALMPAMNGIAAAHWATHQIESRVRATHRAVDLKAVNWLLKSVRPEGAVA